MIQRLLESPLRDLFQRYPVVTLTGPRQSGKTTLCRSTFPDLPYVNLEAGDAREFAESDPRGFLARYPQGAILDEVQRAPDLLSYVQVMVDEAGRNGMFVLTGSRQLLLDERVSQSLAGRTGLLTLLPLSIDELLAFDIDPSTDELIHGGFYPRLYDQHIEPVQALGDYVATYVERDVRQVLQVRDLSLFRRFLKLCAGRVGQLLNYSNLANDAGISHTTVREWLSVLEASYVVFLLQPYLPNVNRRLMKSPKLYFVDVGLASHLLGIEEARQVFTHPLRGALFENLVLAEALKYRTNRGRLGNLHFYRDSSGLEIDGIATGGDGLVALEAKAGATLSGRQLEGLHRFADAVPDRLRARVLVHDGGETFERGGVRITHPRGLRALLEELDSAPPA